MKKAKNATRFSATRPMLYFNTAYTAPLSKAVMDWRKEDDQAYFDGGIIINWGMRKTILKKQERR